MSLNDQIRAFFAGGPHAVVGASRDQTKYGNRVLRAYLEDQRPVYPVNPLAREVEGLPAWKDLASLPVIPHGISIVTLPEVTAQVVAQAIKLGIGHIWIQPGAEHLAAVAAADEAGVNLIAGGPCLLVDRWRAGANGADAR